MGRGEGQGKPSAAAAAAAVTDSLSIRGTGHASGRCVLSHCLGTFHGTVCALESSSCVILPARTLAADSDFCSSLFEFCRVSGKLAKAHRSPVVLFSTVVGACLDYVR